MSTAAPGAKVFGKARAVSYVCRSDVAVDEAEHSLKVSRAQAVKTTIQLRPPDLNPSPLKPAKINLFDGETSKDLSLSIRRRLELLARQMSSIRGGMRLACGGLNGTSNTVPSPLKKVYELLEEIE